MMAWSMIKNHDHIFACLALTECRDKAPLFPAHENLPVHILTVAGICFVTCREQHLMS